VNFAAEHKLEKRQQSGDDPATGSVETITAANPNPPAHVRSGTAQDGNDQVPAGTYAIATSADDSSISLLIGHP